MFVKIESIDKIFYSFLILEKKNTANNEGYLFLAKDS